MKIMDQIKPGTVIEEVDEFIMTPNHLVLSTTNGETIAFRLTEEQQKRLRNSLKIHDAYIRAARLRDD